MTRFEEVFANHGVDSNKLSNEWMIVPLHGTNLVRLSDGLGYSVAELPEHGAKLKEVTEIPPKAVWGTGITGKFIANVLLPGTRYFRVGGRAGGLTTLQAKKGKLTVSLRVSVHPRRSFKLAFFFLQDKDAAGQVKARTVSTLSDADTWTRRLNEVFGSQANIWFENAKSEFLPLENLSVAVGSDQDVEKMAKNRVSGTNTINIFLAGSKIVSQEHDYPLGFYNRPTKIVVVQDQSVGDPWEPHRDPMLKTIAHEIGHFMDSRLGLPGDSHDDYQKSGYTSDILNTLNGLDIKIPHQRVLNWNPW
jgi:hypothetical protein